MGGPTVTETAIAVMSSGQHLNGARSAAIGYAPQVGLQEAVERTLRWFRAQGDVLRATEKLHCVQRPPSNARRFDSRER